MTVHDPYILDALLSALYDPLPHVRINAALTLESMGDLRARDVLREVVKHDGGEDVEGRRVSDYALAALQAIEVRHHETRRDS